MAVKKKLLQWSNSYVFYRLDKTNWQSWKSDSQASFQRDVLASLKAASFQCTNGGGWGRWFAEMLLRALLVSEEQNVYLRAKASFIKRSFGSFGCLRQLLKIAEQQSCGAKSQVWFWVFYETLLINTKRIRLAHKARALLELNLRSEDLLRAEHMFCRFSLQNKSFENLLREWKAREKP